MKKEYPQFDEIKVCESEEEAVRGADIISFTTVAQCGDDPEIVDTYPYVAKEGVKPVFFISMPSAAKFDDEMIVNAKCVVDNKMLYEAWEEEYPYPTYPKIAVIGSKFTNLIYEGKKKEEDILVSTNLLGHGFVVDEEITRFPGFVHKAAVHPVIECPQNIPCNSCHSAYHKGCISIRENMTSLPISVKESTCINCGMLSRSGYLPGRRT